MRQLETLREAVDRHPGEADILTTAPDRDEAQPALPRHGKERLRLGVIGRDHGRCSRREQPAEQAQLGVAVVLDRRMVVEMIARQVGEAAGGDAHAVEAVLIEPVRGGLDGEMGDALVGKRVQGAVQVDRIGRGQRAVRLPLRGDDADRADAGGLVTERRPDLPGEGGDRGLAAGAGDRRDGRGLAGVKARCGKRQRAPRIRNLDDGDAVGE